MFDESSSDLPLGFSPMATRSVPYVVDPARSTEILEGYLGAALTKQRYQEYYQI